MCELDLLPKCAFLHPTSMFTQAPDQEVSRKLISVAEYAAFKGCPLEVITREPDEGLVSKQPVFGAYFKHGNMFVARLPNILFVRRYGALITEEGWILSDTTLNDFAQSASTFKTLPDRPSAPWKEISSPTAIIGGQDNFYHWLFNWMSKFTALNGSIYRAENFLVSGPVRRFHWETLFKFDVVQQRNVYIAQNDDPIFIRDAIVPTMYSNPIHAGHHIDFLKKLIGTGARSPYGERIYVTRKDAQGGARQVLNERDVLNGLHKLGFKPVVLGDLSLAEQAAVFRDAKYIVSPHGAGLSNLIHCSPGTCVLEMQARDHYTKVFWSLGVISGSKRYDVLPCESSGSGPAYLRDITIDIDAMMRNVAEKMNLV